MNELIEKRNEEYMEGNNRKNITDIHTAHADILEQIDSA